ncbi:hypothetical protein D3C78_1472480 [compost metagenome]
MATARQVSDAARLYIQGELSGVTPLTIAVKADTETTPGGLMQRGYLDPGTVLPSNKEVITGGVVTYNGSGVLVSVSFTTASITTEKVIPASEILDGKKAR